MNERRKLLVIDDDDAVTDYLQLKLAAAFEVVALNDPRLALDTVRRERPDAVVCDIDMPEMDGGAVCRALASETDTSAIPFLYLTSMVSREEGQRLDGVIGGRPGVSKHASATEIVARIRALLEAR